MPVRSARALTKCAAAQRGRLNIWRAKSRIPGYAHKANKKIKELEEIIKDFEEGVEFLIDSIGGEEPETPSAEDADAEQGKAGEEDLVPQPPVPEGSVVQPEEGGDVESEEGEEEESDDADGEEAEEGEEDAEVPQRASRSRGRRAASSIAGGVQRVVGLGR